MMYFVTTKGTCFYLISKSILNVNKTSHGFIKYNVLHFRFDFENVKKKVTNNSLFITILRDPVHQFESGIGFFRDWPFQQWLNDTPRAQLLDKFMENPNFYYNTSTPWNFRAKNYMSFDLGKEVVITDSKRCVC